MTDGEDDILARVIDIAMELRPDSSGRIKLPTERELADQLCMPFHDAELTTGEMVSFFPEVVYLRDDPIADIAE